MPPPSACVPLIERALMSPCMLSLACGDLPTAISALRRCLGSSFALSVGGRHWGRALLSSLLLHCCLCARSEYHQALEQDELELLGPSR